MRKKITKGDIFIISDVKMQDEYILSLNKKIRLGKVIFNSKVTKQMIGIIISSEVFDSIPNQISSIHFGNQIFYTSNQLLMNGGWQIVGNQNVSKEEEDLALRLVGSSLRRLDVDLGVVSHQDRKKYKIQYIEGFALICKKINDI